MHTYALAHNCPCAIARTRNCTRTHTSTAVRQPLAAPLRQLFQCLAAHRDKFAAEHSFEVGTWAVGEAAFQLLTDDSYLFAGAVKRLQASLVDLEMFVSRVKVEAEAGPAGDMNLSRPLVERRAALLQAMEVAYTQAPKTWTRASVDALFKAMQDRRLLFPDSDDMRGRLDTLTNALRSKRAANALNAQRSKPYGGASFSSWSS